jgi:hypothetical protein
VQEPVALQAVYTNKQGGGWEWYARMEENLIGLGMGTLQIMKYQSGKS